MGRCHAAHLVVFPVSRGLKDCSAAAGEGESVFPVSRGLKGQERVLHVDGAVFPVSRGLKDRLI